MFKMRALLLLAPLVLFTSFSQGQENVCREGETCSQASKECGIWFAESSIPGSGIGMYAGRTFEKKEPLMATGDVVIPIVDINYYQGKKFKYLWDSYTWSASALNTENEGLYEVDMASPGFGSAANSFRDLVNVDEWMADNDHAGLHRSKDPGAGGFSPYHNRTSTATRQINAGQELFVDYGGSWFKIRTEALGPIPLKGDLKRGSGLLMKFNTLRRKHNETFGTILTDLWETFVWNSSFADSSRVIFGLPRDWEEIEAVFATKRGNYMLFDHRVRQSTRSLGWLKENGICADNIREGPSTIPQAGRGAFATRDLTKDSVIAPLPLIHVPYRKNLEMYEPAPTNAEQFNKYNIVGRQLLLNYCFGNRESTLLLCPYGMLTALINHGSKGRANVRLQWSDPARSSHNPSWLNLSVKELKVQKTSGLSLELVALRDIKEGEEVLLDYGDEWEEAWNAHVDSWKPLEGAAKYISGEDMNADPNSILKTEFEQMHYPYPANVQIMFDYGFRYHRKWQRRTGDLLAFKKESEGSLYKCEILNRTEADDGRILYTIIYTDEEEENEKDKDVRVLAVPREGLEFKDRAYSADFLQKNVFRHDMRLPDNLFPESWKNVGSDGALL